MSTTTTVELREAYSLNTTNRPEITNTDSTLHEESSAPTPKVENRGTTALIISTITGVTTISSLLSGLVTIALPAIAKDLEIPQALLLW